MTKTLTEQWRDNDLADDKLYYWRISDGQELVQNKLGMCAYRLCNDSDKIECLAPAPSYDEYKRLVSNSDESVIKCNQLENKLAIATKALEEIKVRSQRDWDEYNCMECARKALYDIEMEGVK